jgi:hypothetical protein
VTSSSSTETNVPAKLAEAKEPPNVERHCFFCNESEKQIDLTLLSKKEGTFKWTKCNSSRTYFYGSGEMPRVFALTEEDRHAFFMQAKHANKAAQLVMVQTLREKNVDNTMSHQGSKGRFFPLGVLKTMGHDIDRIEKNTSGQDKYFDEQVGMCYRINLKFDDVCHSRGKQRDDTIMATDAPASQSTNIASELSEVLDKMKMSTKQTAANLKKRNAAKDKEMKALNKIKEEVKLHKCPEDFVKHNPLEKLIDTLEKIDCDDANFDAHMIKFKEVAVPMMTEMKAFT